MEERKELLREGELQGIITLVIIFMLGLFSTFTPTWWVRIIGYIVMILTLLNSIHVGKGLYIRWKEQNKEMNDKLSELNKKENDVNEC